jgi:DNA-binding NarL/FixJ family response regulator
VRGRIGIVEDHPIVAEPLADHLRTAGHMVAAPVGFVEDLGPASSLDLVICDYSLPGGRSGEDAVEFLVRQGHRVLATSGVARQEQVLDLIAAGACGFVHKEADIQDYVQAVGIVLTEGYHLSPHLAGYLLDDVDRRPLDSGDIGGLERLLLRTVAQGHTVPAAAEVLNSTPETLHSLARSIFNAARRRRRRHRLSPRERQIILLIADEGLSTRQIARKLGIRPDTVSDHLGSIKRKYQATHPECRDLPPRAIALQWARELGLL